MLAGNGGGTRASTGPRFFMYEGPAYDPSPDVLRYVAESLHDPSDANGEAEHFGEAMMFWELRRHPLRTRDASSASLFVLPAFPQLDPAGAKRAAVSLAQEPTWQRRRGADHLVFCTHWQCGGYLGASGLFEMVALPGLVGALERNMKWLDHRVAHWFNNRSEQTPYDFDSPRPFCLDRTIVIPYPPHTSLMHHCGKQPAYVPWTERRINVSFYGTIRARTGIADSSGGVRSALMQLAQQSVGPAGVTSRGLDVRFVLSNEADPSQRCGPGLAGKCQSLLGSGGRLHGQQYAQAMHASRFCLHLRGDTSTSRRLFDSVAAGCIPIIVSDYIGPNMPFSFAAGQPPLRPPRVRYDDWLIRIREADFVADPRAAIDSVLDRFLLPPPGGGAPLIAGMQAAMRRDAGDVLFCRGRNHRKDVSSEHRLADLVLGEAFARLSHTCSNCSGKAANLVYRLRRIRNEPHIFKYRDCLQPPDVRTNWVWEPPKHRAGEVAEPGEEASSGAFPVNRLFIFL